jgi:hypothetical protein
VSTAARVLSFVLAVAATSFVGCDWNGDVLVSSGSRDLAVGEDYDIAIPEADMSGGCGLNTCALMNATCGPIGDGCGGTLNCGTCTLPQTCGGGGVPYQCGGTAGCIPLTCAQLGLACGPAGDGCGGTIDCGGCSGAQTCGGGGTPGMCGSPNTSGGGNTCVPKTCAQLGFGCGTAGDGCGGTLNCGNCTSPQTCGGGGVPFQCGAPACVPKTCAQLGYNCGPAGDGCGGTLNCGSTCPSGTCGGGGQPNVCGSPSCTPHGCGTANCGQVGNGCGGLTASCGSCPANQSCGGGGTPNVCGAPACSPKTCAQLGYNCGAAGDGCGNLIPGGCGSCTAPNICGAVSPNVCGNNVGGGGTSNCPNNGQTTITGTVVAPTDATAGFGNPDPIYNAVVYVPSGPLQAITTGATCEQCSSSQAYVVSATTGIDGKFTLVNPPTGPGVTVVIQLGKWRRVLTLNVTACTNNVLTTDQTRLPRKQAEFSTYDNIPRLAISTGNVDTMECVLRKMGIADTEFVNPNLSAGGVPQATGRVQLYQATPLTGGNGDPGARISGATPADSTLWGNTTTVNAYDAVLFPCTGGRDTKSTTALSNLVSYANLGGRVFATHFSYVWAYNNTPWGCGNGCTTAGSTTAKWDIDHASYTAQFTGFIDQTFPKGVALAQWLQQAAVAASTTLGQIPVNVVRNDFDSVIAGQQWMYSTHPPNAAAFPMHYTFNTPPTAAPANQCGRVVFSDFHVENSGGSKNVTFPTECNGNSAMTPQEKLLEFMLFDLTSCVQPDVPTCTPTTCAKLGYMCGQWGDGCGGTLNCGTCAAGTVCGGGGGPPGQCTNSCAPTTCAKLGYSCGQWGDGCGGTLDCGACASPKTCGGGGTPGQCGGGCTPLTCPQLGAMCGTQGDGCGGTLNCGPCTSPQTCGGGGTPNQCGGGCKPLTCSQLGLMCGPAGDGCGGTLDCGSCPSGQTCGGGGMPGVCGQPPDGGVGCKPLTCQDQGLSCGKASDGCGNLIDCGPCPAGQTCGGGGTPGQCGAPNCTPKTCKDLNANCGIIGDGCGGTINCGTCKSPDTCGGTGIPWQCGSVG